MRSQRKKRNFWASLRSIFPLSTLSFLLQKEQKRMPLQSGLEEKLLELLFTFVKNKPPN
jgi:hypothetical protein